jgi:hypothetical protein
MNKYLIQKQLYLKNNKNKNYNLIKDSKNIYISLGYNCASRIYIKNYYMSKNNGYLTCPFDLCLTTFESIVKCIETDFKYFFDDLKLIPWKCADGRSIDDLENKNAITNYYNIICNHEGSSHSHLFNIGKNDDLFYIRNEYEEFKKRYTNRINNFRNYLTNYENITFIYNKNIDDITYNNNNINLLINLLKEKYQKICNIIEIN